jgi:hydroxymethylglutaryl-CoA reductase (NADPH)
MGIYSRSDQGELEEVAREADEVFVPLAHTEGGLSESLLRGSRVSAMAGGIRTWLLQDEMTRDCAFVFETAREAMQLRLWLYTHNRDLAAWINDPHLDAGNEGERAMQAAISSHARLLRLRTRVVGPVCHVLYGFDTQEACGPNMMTRNAYALNARIVQLTESEGIHPRQIFLEANLGGDKKPSYEYYTGGHGKTVVAEALIPDALIGRFLHTTTDQLQGLEWAGMHGAHASGMQSFGFTPASAVAAIFAATGQDLGMIGTSSMAHATLSRTSQGIAFSLTLSGVEVGTVGGGTALPHARAYLKLMRCEGPGSARRLAQIIVAAALAVEISAASSMASHGS